MNSYKLLCSILSFCCVLSMLSAQTIIRLDASMNEQQPEKLLFNNAVDAFRAIPLHGATTIEVAPGVYWLDDPDDPQVRTSPSGIPFAVTVRTDTLRMIGLSGNPSNTIFAVNRGQTQGAIGNYTMMHFIGQSVEADHITFGNYCNVDLEYPDNPAFSRRARSKAVVQAQIAICEGTQTVRMDNCRFISRLNLCPFVGAQRAYFSDCHFECTDDALNGSAFYRHCTFLFFSSRPFYATGLTGAIFYDCDIHTRVSDTQYLTKAGGPVTMINTRWHAPSDSLDIQWSKDDQPYYVCYASGVTLNGMPVEIDRHRPWRTVWCDNPMHRYLIPDPAVTNHYPPWGRELSIHSRMVEWGRHPDEAVPQFERDYFCENPSFRAVHDTLMIEHDGLRAIAVVNIDGQVYLAPDFLVAPRLKMRKGKLHVTYRLTDDSAPKDAETNVDNSLITWYKVLEDGKILPVRQGRVGEVAGIDSMDPFADEVLVSVIPKYLDTEAGYSNEARAYMEVKRGKAQTSSRLLIDTDFRDIPCVVAADLSQTDVWQMDCYKPADTEKYTWTADNSRPSWRFGTAPDGAEGEGLVTFSRGARLWYTPSCPIVGNTTLELWADPCKTAGQGFGSATGQYFDIGIGFDIQSLSGYVLRIERSPDYDHAVLFTICRYENGRTTPVSESVPSDCFRTGFHLKLSHADKKLHVKAERSMHESASVVELSVDAPMSGKSIYMQHTGTCGASALMLHRLRIESF